MTTTVPPRDLAGRFGGQGAFEAAVHAPATLFTPLQDAASNLRKTLCAAIEDLLRLDVLPEGAPVPGAVIVASPGAGKSRAARDLLVNLAGDTPAIWHAPTLSLLEEAADHAHNLGGNARLIRGRSALDRTEPDHRMCRKSDLVERGIRLGLNIRESFCDDGAGVRCEYADSCAYLRQFSDPDEDVRHRFMATSYLRLPDPDEVGCSLRVVDETFWAQQLFFATICITEFTTPRTFLRHFTRHGVKEAGRIEQHAELIRASHALVGALLAGKSPVDLPYSAEAFRTLARLEYSARADTPALAPDQSEAQQAGLLARGEKSLRHVSWSAAIWTCLADAKENGRETTECLRFVQGREGAAIRVCRKHALRHRQPMLLLDADADTKILGALGLELRRTVHMNLRPNAEIIQIHDRRMTHGSLLGGSELREHWRRIIRREVLADRMGQGGGVLVGASRKIVQQFFKDAGYDFTAQSDDEVSRIMLETPLHGAHWLWFGGRALGTNRYRDCSTVIVMGREELPVEALEDYGRALWGDRTGCDLEFILPCDDGSLRMPQSEVSYEMADGSAVAVCVPCHPDPLIRRVQIQTRELATRQLVERLRLARSETRKRVILGCNIPIPGLPVNRLVSWDMFRPKRHMAALVDALLETGGLRLSSAGLVEDAPDVFATIDAAKAYLKRSGLRTAGLLVDVPEAIRSRIHVLELRQDRPYARKVSAFVAAKTEAAACQRATSIWGPLVHCECM